MSIGRAGRGRPGSVPSHHSTEGNGSVTVIFLIAAVLTVTAATQEWLRFPAAVPWLIRYGVLFVMLTVACLFVYVGIVRLFFVRKSTR